jgi:hypothetical protein
MFLFLQHTRNPRKAFAWGMRIGRVIVRASERHQRQRATELGVKSRTTSCVYQVREWMQTSLCTSIVESKHDR